MSLYETDYLNKRIRALKEFIASAEANGEIGLRELGEYVLDLYEFELRRVRRR